MFDMMTLAILSNPPNGTPAGLAADGIAFLALWIGRLGGIVAAVGAIKFALSIKSEDGNEKILAALTMLSGFMIISAVNNLDVFTFGAGGADAEFTAIMTFIATWIARVGALTLFIGSLMFGFSIKDQNPAVKVSALKTITAGGITTAVAVILPLFVT